MGMHGRDGRAAFLDGPMARLLAALIIVLCAGLLAYLHREDLGPMLGAEAVDDSDGAADDPAAPCIQQRFAEIDAMIEEGVVGAEQAALFKQRAEAMCRTTEGGGAAPLPIQ